MFKKLFAPPKKVLYIHVVDYRGTYRVEINYNNVFFTALNRVVLDDDAPSRIPRFAGKTAGEAYEYRRDFEKPKPGAAFGWISLRESEILTSMELVEKAIENYLARMEEKGEEIDVIKRKDISLIEWRRILRRPREIRYR